MRRAGCLLLFALAGCGGERAASGPHPRPLRVMSVNQCTDQLVLALLPPERIASVSWLARDPGGSLLAGAAGRVPVNHGTAEEVLAQRPDLIVTGSMTTPVLRGMLRRIGYPLVEVDHAATLADIRRITRQVAAAVGEPARGEALIAGMDRKFAKLARKQASPLGVVVWGRDGFSAEAGTLYDLVLTAAGARNLGQGAGGIERLLETNPALLVQGSATGRPSLGDAVTWHRLVRERWAGRTIRVPQSYYGCGTPMVADAALALRETLRTVNR